jgi:predicted Holliday junction resolvase-like endonuclease
LRQIEQEQEKLLAEKNTVLNQDISEKTRALIMDFNREFASYREQLESDHQELINSREAEIKEKLATYRQEIKLELSLKKKEKAAEMDQLIAESQEYY